ncbi:MAG: hypothetical protein EOP07_08675 [Proteobacteria bacterium]|nr:MAG: hypothetical protein EOP07_08675 [Pseudomonadota bacterium]
MRFIIILLLTISGTGFSQSSIKSYSDKMCFYPGITCPEIGEDYFTIVLPGSTEIAKVTIADINAMRDEVVAQLPPMNMSIPVAQRAKLNGYNRRKLDLEIARQACVAGAGLCAVGSTLLVHPALILAGASVCIGSGLVCAVEVRKRELLLDQLIEENNAKISETMKAALEAQDTSADNPKSGGNGGNGLTKKVRIVTKCAKGRGTEITTGGVKWKRPPQEVCWQTLQ